MNKHLMEFATGLLGVGLSVWLLGLLIILCGPICCLATLIIAAFLDGAFV